MAASQNLGSVADWLMLAVTIIGAWVAINNLRAVRRIEQGSQLMEIDDKYEVALQDSRKALFGLRRSLSAGLTGTADFERELAAAVSRYLDELLKATLVPTEAEEAARKAAEKAKDEYFCLMQLPNYLETVGVLYRDRLVDGSAVLELYDAVLFTVIGSVLPHIKKRRVADENPKHLYWAEKLYDLATERMRPGEATDWAYGLYGKIESRRRSGDRPRWS